MRKEYRVNIFISVLALVLLLSALVPDISSELRECLLIASGVLLVVGISVFFIQKAPTSMEASPTWHLNPDDLDEAILLTDLNGVIITCNTAARELIEFCPKCKNVKELFGKWHELATNASQANDVIDAVLSAPDLQFTDTVFLEDNVTVERSTKPLENQQVRIWTLRDVSQMHMAQNDKAMHTTLLAEDAARNAELAEQLFHAKAELEEKQAELTRLANTDSLTGLWNRRRFTSMGEETIQATQTNSIWVLMMDIDYFKRINDTYGHAAGDVAIRDFANIATSTIGEAGFVGRMGGEEFAAILPDTEINDAIRMAETVRKNVADNRTISENEKLRFTCSIGVAQWNQGEITIEAALDRADQALYSAKSFGRNRVVGYELS
ncbi:GGDEF domain-containing protein [Kordiimonas sp. SCSIO 12603]|uniref:GGDEF domain-containing protein n=1 Tax=Kordiimonas sp. SCSIO 12603 TaxID=2829596 RepID=UPI002106EA04|nr:GGDEF domain-containing protein [Kordiimonas sp. SCSIO 12603]UTW57054.1 GGDEF domain-containing protein [Kordiimonas sp. SCSIO 12603]